MIKKGVCGSRSVTGDACTDLRRSKRGFEGRCMLSNDSVWMIGARREYQGLVDIGNDPTGKGRDR